jgi:hypothetical protein
MRRAESTARMGEIRSVCLIFVRNLQGRDYVRHIDIEGSKVKFSLYRPCRPLELLEVEAPTLSDIRLIDSGKVVSPMGWSLFTPREIPGTHFC